MLSDAISAALPREKCATPIGTDQSGAERPCDLPDLTREVINPEAFFHLCRKPTLCSRVCNNDTRTNNPDLRRGREL